MKSDYLKHVGKMVKNLSINPWFILCIVIILLHCFYFLRNKNRESEMQMSFLEQARTFNEYQTEMPQIMEQLRFGNRKYVIKRLECWIMKLRECKIIPVYQMGPIEGEIILGILYEEDVRIVALSKTSKDIYKYLHENHPDYPFDIYEIQFDKDGAWHIRFSRDGFFKKPHVLFPHTED